MTSNPLLTASALPAFSQVRPEHVGPAIDALLAEQLAGIEAIVASTAPRTWDSVMAAQERFDDKLARAWAPVSHLQSVADTPALRAAYNDALERIAAQSAEIGQNRGLYEAVRAIPEDGLSTVQHKILRDALRDFRLSGVALEEPERSRFKAIVTELSTLGSEFEQALLDATDAWTFDVADVSALSGIPDSGLAVLRQAAADAGVDGWRVTLHQPSYVAVMTYADDRALRAKVYEAYQTRASDQGPHAGRFDNSARIEKILALRHEAARLLGFANAAEESLATKMAGTTQRVLAFLDELAAQVKPVAQRELAELAAFAAAELGLPTLEPWDVAYASEKLRLKRYALAEEELKPYFPLDAALGGFFAVAGKLFGIRFAPREGVDVWHPDVRYYEVLDADDRVFAGVYLDLFARNAKRGGAWMDVCRSRRRENGALQTPIAFLTCNFAAPSGDLPSLLTHEDVQTLFHEFGHGLHHLLTEVDYAPASGIHGVEWDAVELPSQFMENFCWQRAALDLFAFHYETGARLPDELFARMIAARHFHAGLHLVRQLEFALFDFRAHLEFDPARGARVMALLEEVREQIAVVRPPAWQRFPHGFAHIFAGGYDAGYYSYLWAEVLSADAFEQFEEAGVFDVATGERFRREVLAVGGSRPALESFVAFRGREPDPTALLRSYGLAA